jgi:hypothetical protein
LSSLTTTEIYGLIPSYRSRCPLCGGASCAERLGIYERRVQTPDGLFVIRVPRFRCKKKGPKRSVDRTFSVLPEDAIPRRRWSWTLLLQVYLRWQESGNVAVLEQLCRISVIVEDRQLRRVLRLLELLEDRLRAHPIPEHTGEIVVGGRLTAFGEMLRGGRDPPRWPCEWQLHHHRLLVDIRLS